MMDPVLQWEMLNDFLARLAPVRAEYERQRNHQRVREYDERMKHIRAAMQRLKAQFDAVQPAATQRKVFGTLRMPNGTMIRTMTEEAFRRALDAVRLRGAT